MIKGIPKISVLVITFKQKDLIKRAIGSLLVQKDYIYEICISDDCSPDETWEVIQEYDKIYPGLFKLHRNEINLGIFENIEKTWTMPTGDIVYQLSGDDVVPNGWFKTVIDFIRDNEIDYRNELFCVYGDYQCVYPNGDLYVSYNSNILYNPSEALRLSIRGRLGNRSACYSKKIMDKYPKLSVGKSHLVETIQDRLLQIYTEKNYYINFSGNVYYTGLGVSSSLSDSVKREREQIWSYTLMCFERMGISIKKKDLLYIKYLDALKKFIYWHDYKQLFLSLYYYIVSMDFSLKGNSNIIRRYLFAVLRRIPHKKPIKFL